MENIALVTVKLPMSGSARPSSRPPPSRSNVLPKPQAAGYGSKANTAEPPLAVKFLAAGTAACIADLITFPLDTAKVRLQIQGEVASPSLAAARAREAAALDSAIQSIKYRGMLGTLLTISREEGARALYNGLVPGLQRQMAFASIRIGLYDTVKQFYVRLFHGQDSVSNANVGLRILAGITTGGMAVCVAQPTDVVKVRMQAQTQGVRRYNGCMHAYRSIMMADGIRGLWKGVLPNITRNAVINAGELVSYDLIKESILRNNLLSDSMPCHFVSAFGAGFFATVVASPIDVVKTRYMNADVGVYPGAMQCAITMAREGGPMAFYKGFMPSFIRLGSWNIVMFMTFEQLKRVVMEFRETSHKLPQPTQLHMQFADFNPVKHKLQNL